MTPRETQILSLIRNGQSPKEIAFACGITPSTVYEYIRRLKILHKADSILQLATKHE